ncbi:MULTISPECIES: hypothetical protein [unclassified Streptomyces]|uniref:hypothetical protein n=1 Tax=unclassified Streptomyces TaxID=2593676 RepID=UPI003BB4C4F6
MRKRRLDEPAGRRSGPAPLLPEFVLCGWIVVGPARLGLDRARHRRAAEGVLVSG